jgi:hypothetical protein
LETIDYTCVFFLTSFHVLYDEKIDRSHVSISVNTLHFF